MPWQDPDGPELRLDRWPEGSPDGLQAWDAADEYLLQQWRAAALPAGARLLLVDDHWGALAVALAGCRPVAWGDSHLGALALAANLERNGLPAGAVPFIAGTNDPGGPYDAALLRLPKALEALEDTLRRLRTALAPGALILAGGMIKHTPTRAWRLLEQYVGPTPTTPGWKKARVGTAVFTDPVPGTTPTIGTYSLPSDSLELQGGPGVFGGGRLDGGAALLLRHVPATDAPLAAADLGCGDGILALALARRCPRATVLAVDESYRAVACTAANLARNFVGDDAAARVTIRVADGLAAVAPGSLDLVLCNPPFHQGHAVADTVAGRLFEQAHAALRAEGRLLVVGNRHLGHHAKLDRLFGGHELVDGDGRFVVLAATRRG
jgi:23S rRNA (guanine1835-N2)-methyltransferase